MKIYGVSISEGNKKLGAIPSVSLPPVKTCPVGCPCSKACYAAHLCKRWPNVRNAYENNLSAWKSDPDQYFGAVNVAAKMSRFFRWHVSGDIPSPAYLEGMIATAKANPDTLFLAFTKRYFFVNQYLDNGGVIPDNLIVIFSAWSKDWPVPNPHNLPVCYIIFKGDPEPTDGHICRGNCTECALTRTGCFGATRGGKIYIHEHN